MSRVHTLGQHNYVVCNEHNYTASASGTAVDCQGWSAAQIVVLATSGTGSTWAGTLYESADNVTFTSVGSVGTVAASKTAYPLTCSINLKSRSRYLKLVYTITGTVNATNVWNLFNQTGTPVVQTNGDLLL